MAKACNSQDIFLSRDRGLRAASRDEPISSMMGGGGSLRAWGGDAREPEHFYSSAGKGRGRDFDDVDRPVGKGKGKGGWEDAFAMGYAMAMKMSGGEGRYADEAPRRRGGSDLDLLRRSRSPPPMRGRKGKGKARDGGLGDDPFRNFGSSRGAKGDKGDRKGGKSRGKGKGRREDIPIDSVKLDDALDSYFGKEPSKKPQAKNSKGKGAGKEMKTAEELDSELGAYFGGAAKKDAGKSEGILKDEGESKMDTAEKKDEKPAEAEKPA